MLDHTAPFVPAPGSSLRGFDHTRGDQRFFDPQEAATVAAQRENALGRGVQSVRQVSGPILGSDPLFLVQDRSTL